MCIVVPSGCVLPGDIKPIALGKRSSNHVGGSSPKKKCSSPINETDIKETLNHPKELTQSQRERARTNAFSNLIQASRIGDVNKIKEIAETHPEVINSLHIGYSALHYAVFYNHKAAVEALIEAGADIDNRNPGNGITPLAWGVDRNHCDLVGYLLECEADPSLANRDGITPLHTATKLKNYKMVETLLSINTETEEWTKVNARTNEGCTPAYFAAFDGSLDILALLYEYGGDFNISSNVNVSPLHRAVKRSQIESVKYIIENGGDINKQDENGRTCLHIAALAGNIEMLKLLLQFKPTMLFDNNNISPIDLARMRLLVAAEELLEEYSCTTWPIH